MLGVEHSRSVITSLIASKATLALNAVLCFPRIVMSHSFAVDPGGLGLGAELSLSDLSEIPCPPQASVPQDLVEPWLPNRVQGPLRRISWLPFSEPIGIILPGDMSTAS